MIVYPAMTTPNVKLYRVPCESNGLLSKGCLTLGPYDTTPALASSRAVDMGWTEYSERTEGLDWKIYLCPECKLGLGSISSTCSQCDTPLVGIRSLMAGICDFCAGFFVK